MDANEFKEMLTINDMYSLLHHLGAEPEIRNSVIYCKTICHNGDGHNLRYYSDTYSFYCFSHCSSMSIYDLVGKTLDLEFYESFKYVLSFFNYSLSDISFKNESYENSIDISFFERGNKKEIKTNKKLNSNILNNFYDLYYKAWIDEGITIETMKKFNIKNSIADKQIIIPHYDEDDNLIGVRCRNLNEELVNNGKKYMPIYYNGEILNHSTGSALYGLNFNKESINKHKKIILFESEKAVMQLDSYMSDMSIGVCLSGSNLTNYQVEILKKLDINEVIIALDKEYENIGTDEEKFYAKKIQKSIVDKISSFWSVSIIWDVHNLLDKKDSPTDRGSEVFKELFYNRIFLIQE